MATSVWKNINNEGQFDNLLTHQEEIERLETEEARSQTEEGRSQAEERERENLKK